MSEAPPTRSELTFTYQGHRVAALILAVACVALIVADLWAHGGPWGYWARFTGVAAVVLAIRIDLKSSWQ